MKFVHMVLALLLLASLSSPSHAAMESEWTTADYVRARLLNGTVKKGDKNIFTGAVEIDLTKGWHAYWRMPGEGGLPPEFNWNGSANIEDIEIAWPTPKRYNDFGLQSFGYEGNFLFPLTAQVPNVDETISFNLDLNIMVCYNICVPQRVSMQFIITPDEFDKRTHVKAIARAREKLPIQGETASLRIDNVVIGPDALVVTAWSARGFEDADLYIESGNFYVTAIPEIRLDKKDARRAILRVAAPEGIDDLAEILMDQEITLTLVQHDKAIERTFKF